MACLFQAMLIFFPSNGDFRSQVLSVVVTLVKDLDAASHMEKRLGSAPCDTNQGLY